jgi:hypothetical protein
VILWVAAAALGIIMIILGFVAPTNEKGEWHNWVAQFVLGLFNTVLLAAALLGVFEGL